MRDYSYEDEKQDVLNSYLLDKSKLTGELFLLNLKLMQIKIDLRIIGRLSIKNFRLECDEIIRKL